MGDTKVEAPAVEEASVPKQAPGYYTYGAHRSFQAGQRNGDHTVLTCDASGRFDPVTEEDVKLLDYHVSQGRLYKVAG